MSDPLVSICLPNLNTRPYLEERLQSITCQTYGNWELIVSDNYSDDGSWELFEAAAKKDPRISIAQAPREGMYANWNRCLDRARGTFVYIATSDDTMAPDCLEKLVGALTRHPGCDIAHCALRPLDAEGRVHRGLERWWRTSSAFALSSGVLFDSAHIRRAPFDGLLHLLGGSVYVSITQLLVRRTLFERIGNFETQWGSLGDFNWCMRATLCASTVHVPDTWGGWRIHPAQATAAAGFGSEGHELLIDQMLDHAVRASGAWQAPQDQELVHRLLSEARGIRAYMREVESYTSVTKLVYGVARKVAAGSFAARQHLKLRLRGGTIADWIPRVLEATGHEKMLIPVADSTSKPHVRKRHRDAAQ